MMGNLDNCYPICNYENLSCLNCKIFMLFDKVFFSKDTRVVIH